MPDVTPIPDWVRLSHRTVVSYGAVCLVAGCVALYCSDGGAWTWLIAPLLVMVVLCLAGLPAMVAFGLGHWIGDLVTKRQKGHVVARMLSRNAQSVHGTAIVVLGTCGTYPWLWSVKQHGLVLGVSMLVLNLFALALSASAHTARRRRRPLVAAWFAAATYAAIGVLVGLLDGAMWMGVFALPFAAYFAATALWLIREPQWHDA